MRFTSILVSAMAAIASAIPTAVTPAAADPTDDVGHLDTFTLTQGDFLFCIAECAEYCIEPGDYWCEFCVVGCLAFYQHHPKSEKFDPKSIPEPAHAGSDSH